MPLVQCAVFTVCVVLVWLSIQLTAGYKERRQVVDQLKEQLQHKISSYSKLSEHGECC